MTYFYDMRELTESETEWVSGGEILTYCNQVGQNEYGEAQWVTTYWNTETSTWLDESAFYDCPIEPDIYNTRYSNT